MLTSLKMEAIEECDSEDASVVGDDGRSRSAEAQKSSNRPASSRRQESAPKPKPKPTLATSPAITRERSVDVPLPATKIPGTTEDDEDSETPTEKTTDDESSTEKNPEAAEAKEIRAFELEDGSCDGGIFDYDDEMLEVSKDEEEEDQLTWRLDPEESLSDWTVILTNKLNGEVKPYHLHKNILAVGPRKCDYFVGVFKSNRTQGAASNKTEMGLEAPAFDCFPHFLDYVYSTHELELTTETATALRHLAKCFGLKIMFKQATEFLLKDIALSNILTYYKHSVILLDEKITAMVARHLARNIMKIEVSGEVVKAVDPEFLLRVLSAPEIDTKNKHYHVSLLLAEYCKLNKERMDAAIFLKLIDEKILPVIDHTVGLVMLEMEADLVVVASSVLKFSNITSLQKRCIKDLSSHWKEFSEVEREQVGRVCRKLPSGVVTELLVRSLTHAKRKSEQSGEKPKLTLRKLVENVTAKSKKDQESDSSSTGSAPDGPSKQEAQQRLNQAKKEFEAKAVDLKREHQEEMAHLKKEYETNLLKLRDMCLEKDKHIANYWQELQRYVRVPNAPEGKFGPSGMMNKVTKMPEIGKTSSEGHLYSTKIAGEVKRHPMFYYQAD
jgi:hypothetical protein